MIVTMTMKTGERQRLKDIKMTMKRTVSVIKTMRMIMTMKVTMTLKVTIFIKVTMTVTMKTATMITMTIDEGDDNS